VYLSIVNLCKNCLYDKATSNGSIVSHRLVMDMDILCCLKTPDDGHKEPKHVARKYFNKLNCYIDNLIR
jgi:hypothetical protein